MFQTQYIVGYKVIKLFSGKSSYDISEEYLEDLLFFS